MKRYCLTIDSSGAHVSATSSEIELLQALARSEFLRRYVPSCRALNDLAPSVVNITLKTGKPSFLLKYPKAEYTNTSYEDKDIVSLVEFLFERARQEVGIYCLHSSSVIVKGRSVIFWGGASGMGKTQLALAMSEKFGARMYSDEKTLLNLRKNITVGGVASVYLLKPYLQDKFNDTGFHDFPQSKQSFPVGFFVYPNIDEHSRSVHAERWDADKFNWHLYEELSRKIRGTSRRIFHNTLPVLSIDSLPVAKQRSAEVELYTKKVPCYYMRGGEKLICERIVELCKNITLKSFG